MRFSQLDNFSIQRLFFWFKEMKKNVKILIIVYSREVG